MPRRSASRSATHEPRQLLSVADEGRADSEVVRSRPDIGHSDGSRPGHADGGEDVAGDSAKFVIICTLTWTIVNRALVAPEGAVAFFWIKRLIKRCLSDLQPVMMRKPYVVPLGSKRG